MQREVPHEIKTINHVCAIHVILIILYSKLTWRVRRFTIEVGVAEIGSDLPFSYL